jgi:hypothetical protein
MTSKLATFRIDSDIWDKFQAKAKANGTNASALLQNFLSDYLYDCIDKKSIQSEVSIDTCIDKQSIQSEVGIDNCIDERIAVLLDERIAIVEQKLQATLQDAIAKQNTTESSLLFHSEIVTPVSSETPGTIAAANITYALNLDCSINLESIKGIEIQDLKLLESWQLKELGLKREYDEVQGKLKFFPIHSDKALKCLEPDALVSEKATSPAKKSITYQIAKDGSIVLRSLRGTDSRTLKRMNTQDLKEIGLFKTLIGANEKFFPI